MAPSGEPAKLLNWDSFHYAEIVENGYHSTPEPTSGDVHASRANVVFFPGYPASARALKWLGLSTEGALLAVAWGGCVLFWAYFLLILSDLWGCEEKKTLATAGVVAVFPASFFLITGYTESLFLACALGFVYWTGRWRREQRAAYWLLAAVHGLAMSLTRIVGLGVAVYPVLALWSVRKKRLPALLLATVAGAGVVLFFAYCQLKLGDWRIYFRLEEIGWGNYTYPLALLDPRSYLPHYFFEPTEDSISRSAVPFIMAVFVFLLVQERRAKLAGFFKRLPLYLIAYFMFQIAVSAKANAKMDSMIRYALPVFVLQMICLTGLRAERGTMRTTPAWQKAALGLGLALFLATQIWLLYRFKIGHWAA